MMEQLLQSTSLGKSSPGLADGATPLSEEVVPSIVSDEGPMSVLSQQFQTIQPFVQKGIRKMLGEARMFGGLGLFTQGGQNGEI